MRSHLKYRLALLIVIFCLIVITLNLYIDINALDSTGIILDSLLIVAIIILFILHNKYNLLCRGNINCLYINQELEKGAEGIKSHLKDQRHDFLNVMQILYGYTQLKKQDKIIDYILSYSKKVENLGRLYNMKNIKFADMLYNMGRVSDNLGINFNIFINTSDSNHNPVLEGKSTLYVVEGIINNYFYIINQSKNPKLGLKFKLSDKRYKTEMELCITGESINSEDFKFPQTQLFWHDTKKHIYPMDSIKKECTKLGMDIFISDDLRETKLRF